MPEYETIRYEQHGRVARLVLNRPQVRNAQSWRLLEELDAAFQHASDDRSVGVIVLAGEGDHFSGGHDLGSPEQKGDMAARPREEGVRGRYDGSYAINVETNLRWRNVPKPTIAEVKGYTIFAGVAIASACDLIFAADDTMFLPTNYQYFAVPWDMGIRKTKEFLFESRFIDAQEALAAGLVNRVIPKARLEQETMEYAARVAENDPFQLRMIKLATNQAQDAQGFTQHVQGAFSFHLLSSVGEGDPGYALTKPMDSGQRRRPMVQRAIENYEIEKERRARAAEE
ncbi:MAG: enoyl-CoA hydratase-related protein [Dehalococcoidia bacterium]|nr:enoyl-CoA hydratase-related protein [Dehalococcoidia bacterium]